MLNPKKLHTRLNQAAKRAVRVGACFFLVASGAFALSGCRDSQAIKNIEYDQNSEKVDTESGKTYTIPDQNGRLTDQDTGLYEVGKGENGEALRANVVYASKDAETELPTNRFVYDPLSNNDSEATEGVRVEPQSDPEPEDQPEPDQRPQQNNSPQNNTNQKPQDSGESDAGDADDKDDKKDSGKKKPNKKDEAPKDDPKDKDELPKTYDATGADDPDLPEVATVAAYGQMAVIVQMLGGQENTTPLAVTDSDLGGNASFKKVFQDEGIGDVKTNGWKLSKGRYVIDVDEVIAAKPEAVLVYSEDELTKKQRIALGKADVKIVTLPRLESATGIVRAVEYVGRMLNHVTDDESQERAKDYSDYHKNLMTELQAGRGYASYLDVCYDALLKPKPRRYDANRFTLLIDQWDYKATYSYRNAVSDAGAGVGASTSGYRTSPVSYYMGNAGVVNNAAAIAKTSKSLDGLLTPAWQFSTRQLDPDKVKWSSDFSSKDKFESWNNFANATLTCVDSNKNNLPQNALGTEKYPYVIVADQKMRTKFLASAQSSKGLYHGYGTISEGDGNSTAHGTMAGSEAVYAAIDESVDLNQAVLVNPHGLFADWTKGSVESCLEGVWITDNPAFDCQWSGSVRDEIKDFYQRFYRYDLSGSELDQILKGAQG
ncbi:MAG: hypothetical protein Q4D06_06530 [Coriobacteriia bacterium]|nr:hypothetical protein [Coriobacteriia bacterium]